MPFASVEGTHALAPATFNAVTQAASDGLLVAFVDASADDEHDGEADLSVSVGATQDSIAAHAGSHAQFVKRWGMRVRYGAVTAPIRKDEYYLAAAPEAVATGALLQLGDRPDSLGTPVRNLDPSGTAAEDGLLLVSLTTDGDGARGSAYGTVNGQRVSSCSVHAFAGHQRRFAQGSFCMPVRRDQAYVVGVIETHLTLSMTATWYPLAGLTFPTKAQQVEPGVTYTPDGPGLVFGSLHTDNGPRGVARVLAGPDADALTVRQATATHQWYKDDTYVPDAGMTVPIGQGESYRLEQEWSVPEPDTQFLWLALQSSSG